MRAKGVDVDRVDDTFSLGGRCARSPGYKTCGLACIRPVYMRHSMRQAEIMFGDMMLWRYGTCDQALGTRGNGGRALINVSNACV